MKWIDTANLRSWASRRDCQDQLPLLVRKLIRATSSSIKKISFPAGENVLIGGWDGILEVSEETDYLTLGTSLWEFGTASDIKGKADGDYEKRKGNALGFNPADATYIFVTPRLWTKKDEWIAEKNLELFWKEVRVYDAQDLEEWIETAPSVGAWLAVNHLSILPKGIQPADDFWEEWSTGNKIKFTPNVVLAGRQKQVEALFSQSKHPSLIPIRGTSREEAIAFVIAAYKNDDVVVEDFFARALIVDSPDAFREILVANKRLYLFVRFEDDNIINRAKSKGHVVYVPLGIDNSGQWEDRINLPALEREEFLEALVDSGLERTEAEKISKRSARNLSVLRRQLEFNRLIPEWAHPKNVRDLIPAMLAGRWDENIEGDKKVIELFANEDYDKYTAKLKRWIYTPDAPVVQIGGSWRLTSPLDAWTHAGKYCTRADFDKLKQAFTDIYSEIDPKFNLEAEERHRASWLGVRPVNSRWMREGLIQSIILVSMYGDKIKIDLPDRPDKWVDYIIANLLATENPALWKSLDHELPLLAEASPASFVARVEDLLKIENGPLQQLFEEEKGFLHSNSYHTGLLWALENLAWMPEHLTRVALVLANLAQNDPGGSLANRPINSLREIFKSWFPQSLGKLTDRIEALKLMMKAYKEIGKTVVKSLLPSGHGTASPTHRMRWRLSDETIPHGVSYEELYNTYSLAIELLFDQFDDTEASFDLLVEKSFDLNPWDREKVLDFLEQHLDKVDHATNKSWHTLRKMVGRHRTYPDADWSLPEEVLLRYEKLYNSLTPADPLDQNTWILREHWPEAIEGKPRRLGHEEQAKIIHDKKVNAVKFLYDNYGLGKILEIRSQLSGIELQTFGFAVADVINDENELSEIWEGLKTDGTKTIFAQSIIDRKRRLHGNQPVFELYEKLRAKGFGPMALTNVFLKLVAGGVLWDFIDTTSQEVSDEYWKRVDSFYFYAPTEDLSKAISKLMQYNRFTSAIHVASNAAEQLDESLLVEVLTNFISNKLEENVRLDSYEIQHIFEELRKKNTPDHNTLIRLEWLYLPLLDQGFDHGNTPILHREMAENPEFFIQVLEQLYKTETDDEQEAELTEEQIQQKAQMAQSAYKLFQTWHAIPGTDIQGDIDADKLNNWVNRVLELAKESDRLTFAEGKIGDVFAKYPEINKEMDPQKELNWPPDILCEIMEGINSNSLFESFRTSTYNKRGFSSRGPFDGGAREWHIGKYFRTLGQIKSAKFPHITALLEDLAKDFEHQAKYEDERAERDKLDY